MTIPVQCLACSAKMNAPDNIAGKKVKCPKCSNSITVPKPRFEEEEDEDNRPRKKSRQRDYQDDDFDEDYEERPRRKKARSKSSGIPTWVYLASGGGVLLIAVVVIVFISQSSGGKEAVDDSTRGGSSTPGGYSSVRESKGGFGVFLPGAASKVKMTINGQDGDAIGHYQWSGKMPGDNFRRFSQATAGSFPLPAGYNPGTRPEQLFELIKTGEFLTYGFEPKIVVQKAITMGGNPGLELHCMETPHLMGEPGNKFFEESNQKEIDRVEKKGGKGVFLVTTDGKRAYVIHLSKEGSFPDEEMIKIIRESFVFL
jgi:hypothetical protein